MLFDKKRRFLSFLITLLFTLQLFSLSAAGAGIGPSNPVAANLSANGAIAPAAFKNIKQTVKRGVILTNDKLGENFQKDLKLYDEIKNTDTTSSTLPQYKLRQNALIKKGSISSVYSQYKKGTILFDEKNKIAVKVLDNISLEDSQDKDYVVVGLPQIHEVLDNYYIPRQTVDLNRGNITGFEHNVQESIDSGNSNNDNQDTILSNNPLIKFTFGSDKPLIAYDKNGAKFNLKIDGHFGIDRITADGFYEFNGNYRFTLKTAEELKLKITSEAKIDTNLTVPLFGIDIPAGIGRVTGAVSLVIGANGSLRLEASAHQWLKAEAGIEGGTFWGIPTSFRPICNIEKDFDVDVDFKGKINGYVKAGPILDIELLGQDLAGAGLFVGLGVTCSTSANLQENEFNADIHGLLEIYASILGKKKTLVDEKYTLYQLMKRDTGNYDIRFNEACLYRNAIWGNIKLLDSQNPYVGEAKLTIEKINGTKTPINIKSNNKGDFHIDFATGIGLNANDKTAGIRLNASDKIYVSSVSGAAITSDPINPTFPFNEIVIDYADFFNDAAVGHVSPARVMNWLTNQFEYLNYARDITFTINGSKPAANKTGMIASGKPVTKTVKCDASGNFKLSYDFKPDNKVTSTIDCSGTRINSKTVKADAELYGKYLTDLVEVGEYTEDGRVIELKKETDAYMIYNLRGNKSVNQTATLTMDYNIFKPLSYIIDGVTGHSLAPSIPAVTEIITQKAVPVMNTVKLPALPGSSGNGIQLLLPPSGSSKATREFVTEWGWGEGHTNAIKSPVIVTDDKPVVFRYESDRSRPATVSDNTYGGNVLTQGGVNDIKRSGSLQLVYEGKTILVIEIVPDIDYVVAGSNKITGLDPLTRVMIDKINSHINPDPTFNIKNGSVSRVTPGR